MENSPETAKKHRHLRHTAPSPWVCRFAPLIRPSGTVLDLACGGGRHSRHLLDMGYAVVGVDRVLDPIGDIVDNARMEAIEADLEDGSPWPLAGRTFAGIVVTNYLHRPHFPRLLDAVGSGGVLIYETFACGNEEYTRPRNSDHLLMSGELLELVKGRFQVVAYEHGWIDKGPLPGVTQRICAVNNLGVSERENGEPIPQALFPQALKQAPE